MTNDTKQILSSVRQKDIYGEHVVELVKKVVSNYYDLPLSAYVSKSRKRQVIKLKQTSVFFMKKMIPKATLQFIGKCMNYNHASIIHCIRTVDNLLAHDKETQKDIGYIEQMLQVESDVIKNNGNIEDDYYYINLDECLSVKTDNNKAIVFSGYTPEETAQIMFLINNQQLPTPKVKKHVKTGLFILDYDKNKTDETN
jgi:hypothetical protein